MHSDDVTEVRWQMLLLSSVLQVIDRWQSSSCYVWIESRVPTHCGKSGNWKGQKIGEFHLSCGKYWTPDCLYEAHGYCCTVAVFWELKLIVTKSDIMSKILQSCATWWQIEVTEGEEEMTILSDNVVINGYGMSHLLMMEKSQFHCYKSSYTVILWIAIYGSFYNVSACFTFHIRAAYSARFVVYI